MVAALFRALPGAGITALRFDFRPGAGAEDTDLAEERLDVLAALDELARTVPERPLFLAGYSFGAGVALGVEHPAVSALVAVAPPLAVMPVRTAEPCRRSSSCPPTTSSRHPPSPRRSSPTWPTATLEVIPGADHFLTGHTAEVADRTTRWLVEQAEARLATSG